jgi:hypothetical protein
MALERPSKVSLSSVNTMAIDETAKVLLSLPSSDTG